MIAPFLFLLAQTDARLAGASRAEAAGWVEMRLTGTPTQMGYQNGYLSAPEFRPAFEELKKDLAQRTRKEWRWFRESAQTVLWPGTPTEVREELDGIVDGLNARDVRVDRWDVVAWNGHIELEGYYLPWLQKRASDRLACSAFVAAGDAVEGGGFVMGHNLWWDWRLGARWRFLMDVRPASGRRFVMQALPAFVHSGSDFALNSAGVALCETTISDFEGFDPTGVPEFARMRQAIQYAEGIDDVAERFRTGNNGGYANAWLIADAKTGEIAKLELGLKHTPMKRTKNGWFVGSNFPDDPDLRRDEAPGYRGTMANGCERRRVRWEALLKEEKGKISAERAKTYLADTTDPTGARGPNDGTLCGRTAWGGAVSAFVTDTALARKMTVEARAGAPDGATVVFPGVRIEPHPWVRFSAP